MVDGAGAQDVTRLRSDGDQERMVEVEELEMGQMRNRGRALDTQIGDGVYQQYSEHGRGRGPARFPYPSNYITELGPLMMSSHKAWHLIGRATAELA